MFMVVGSQVELLRLWGNIIYNDVYVDYLHYKLQTVKWATIALQNHREGEPWREAGYEEIIENK